MGLKLLLGIDIGTTNAKGALFGFDGKLVDSASESYPIHHIKGGGAEQDPDDWWKAVINIVNNLIYSNDDIEPEDIAGVGVSGQGAGVLPISHNGKCLYRALIWMDQRAQKQTQCFKDTIGDFVFQKNGNLLAAWNAEPKMLWFKENHPDIYNRTERFVTATGYINFKLTGELFMNVSDAGIWLSYDREERDWSHAICSKFGLSGDKYPPIVKSAKIAGEVSDDAAEATGLAVGTPVVGGGEDTSSAALACGVVRPGQGYYSMGTGSNVGIYCKESVTDRRLQAFPHVISNVDLINATMSSTGASLDWFKEQLGQIEKVYSQTVGANTHSLLDRAAEQANTGSSGVIFLPYMAGEIHPVLNPNARGLYFGLSLKTTRNDLIRAIMEGTGYALFHNIKIAHEAGASINELRAIGGPTKSNLWNQINSDITGVPILIPDSKTGAPFGNAILAGVGIGAYSNLITATDKMVKIKRRYEPCPENHKIYKNMFEIYLRLYEKVEQEYDALASLEDIIND